MRTILFIITRWVLELSFVTVLFCAIAKGRMELGYVDDSDVFLASFFLYIKLSAIVAIPWGIFFRARSVKNNGEIEAGSVIIAFVLHIIITFLYLITVSERGVVSLWVWMPCIAALVPLVYALLLWIWNVSKDLDKRDRAQNSKPPQNDQSVRDDIKKISDTVSAMIDSIAKLEKQIKKIQKSKPKRKKNSAK